MASKIVLLPGDGIGPEIVAATRRVLDAVGTFQYEEHVVGGASIDAHGAALQDEVLDACRAAGRRSGRVTSVDKANVLETSRLWRQTVTELAAGGTGIQLDHMLVDNAAMQLVSEPSRFDVILTENMFGDILSDEAAMLTGSLGMLPSASLGDSGPGLFEPVHGSAPDIAGKGIANPLATILAAAMLLRHSLNLDDEARAIEAAVNAVLQAGHRTADIAAGGQSVST